MVYAGKKTLTFPLIYKPKKGESFVLNTAPYQSTIIRIEKFVDTRPDKTRIGKNVEDEDDPPKPVYTDSDVGQFASDVLKQEFASAGLRLAVENPTHIISGEVTEFFVIESNSYDSVVAMQVTVKDAKTGETKFTGTAKGIADNFGRSYKVENYQEVLSNAVLQVYQQLLKQPSFLKSLE